MTFNTVMGVRPVTPEDVIPKDLPIDPVDLSNVMKYFNNALTANGEILKKEGRVTILAYPSQYRLKYNGRMDDEIVRIYQQAGWNVRFTSTYTSVWEKKPVTLIRTPDANPWDVPFLPLPGRLPYVTKEWTDWLPNPHGTGTYINGDA